MIFWRHLTKAQSSSRPVGAIETEEGKSKDGMVPARPDSWKAWKEAARSRTFHLRIFRSLTPIQHCTLSFRVLDEL